MTLTIMAGFKFGLGLALAGFTVALTLTVLCLIAIVTYLFCSK